MFHLSSAVSRSHKFEEDDVLRTKFALKDIGYYDEPEYSMTPYSDERSLTASKNFKKTKAWKSMALCTHKAKRQQRLAKRLLSRGEQNRKRLE
jgi:hypothetical protein